MRAGFKRLDIRITVAYGVVAALWVIFSDGLVALLPLEIPAAATLIDILKGLLFVAVTTAALFAILSTELRKRVQAEHAAERSNELERAKQRVEAILNNSPDGILLASSDLRIEQVNRAFNSLLRSDFDD
ncbi:MAG: PAS domain-containing protein [Candidatus Methanoperedens sp.]|nr:PAS domain-containing protein [Candidatus Methanoperedens sp.]